MRQCLQLQSREDNESEQQNFIDTNDRNCMAHRTYNRSFLICVAVKVIRKRIGLHSIDLLSLVVAPVHTLEMRAMELKLISRFGKPEAFYY